MSLRDDWRLLRLRRDWRGRSATPRTAQPAVPDEDAEVFPTSWARRPAARALRRGLQRGALNPITRQQTQAEISGVEYLQHLHGPAIFVANHSSHLDTPLILSSLPRRFTDQLAVGAAADYFFESRTVATVTTLLFNGFPVQRRGSGRASNLAVELLDEGWSLLLYPEGSRSDDGWMRSFKLGAAHLCVSAGVPAVPIGLRGSYQAMPRGRRWPVPGRPRVAVRYGRPLYPESGESQRDFRIRMSRAVAALWAEDDLGWYGALRAAAEDTLTLPLTRRPIVPTGTDRAAGTPRWRRVWESTRPLRKPGPRRVWRDRS